MPRFAPPIVLAIATMILALRPLAQAAPPAATNPGARYSLSCAVDASRAPRSLVLKNDQKAPIRARTRVWGALLDGPDRRPVSLSLNADLAPGATVKIDTPSASPSTRCEGWFHAGLPDLVVDALSWTTIAVGSSRVDAARVVVSNKDYFAEAPVTRTRVSSMACPGSVLDERIAVTPVIPGGGSITITVVVSRPRRDAYLRAEANASEPTQEADRGNNVSDQHDEACRGR